jgi:putative membrane protein
MTRLLRLLLGLAALLVIIGFAVANRTPVDVGLAPLPGAIELPVYGVFLLGLVLGALIGGIGVWLSGLAKRREAKRVRNRLWALENQANVLKKQSQKAEADHYAAQRAVAAQGAGD